MSMLFCQQPRLAFRAEYPEISSQDVTEMLAKKWNTMSEELFRSMSMELLDVSRGNDPAKGINDLSF
jgi:hypothetical protein